MNKFKDIKESAVRREKLHSHEGSKKTIKEDLFTSQRSLMAFEPFGGALTRIDEQFCKLYPPPHALLDRGMNRP